MGMEIPMQEEDEQCVKHDESSMQSRPSILMVGPQNVGKRSILNRLLGNGRTSDFIPLGEVTCHGWTIDTKYYTAKVCIWLANIDSKNINAGQRVHSLSGFCEALIMVFDLSNPSSFAELQQWASGVNLHAFEILLCVGNKADRLPDHFGHSEYRQRLEKYGQSSSDPHPEYADFGIDRSEAAGLLEVDHSPTDDRKGSRLDWCAENGIEYVEACAIDETFDCCMSINGDMQGVARLQGALFAHMWPGMIVKPLDKLTEAAQVKHEKDVSGSSSDSDSEYVIEYELLSNASGDTGEGEQYGEFEQDLFEQIHICESSEQDNCASNGDAEVEAVSLDNKNEVEHEPARIIFSSAQTSTEHLVAPQTTGMETADYLQNVEPTERVSNQINSSRRDAMPDGLDQLMEDMASMREHMKMMPDANRREMAAKLAMRMASMFGEDEDGDD